MPELLYSTFVREMKKSFEDAIDLFEACTLIIQSDEKPLLLCVDEINKSVNPVEIATKLGNLLSAVQDVYVVISTLDWTPLQKSSQRSQRPLLGFNLTRLSISDSLSLFGKVEPNSLLETAIIACNGHPATLSLLADYVKNCHLLNQPLPATLFDFIREFCGKRIGSEHIPKLEHIQMALEGKYLDLDNTIVLGHSFRQLIHDGIFINAITPSSQNEIPLLSPIQIYMWASTGDYFEKNMAKVPVKAMLKL
jgi:hypothetical protein